MNDLLTKIRNWYAAYHSDDRGDEFARKSRGAILTVVVLAVLLFILAVGLGSANN